MALMLQLLFAFLQRHVLWHKIVVMPRFAIIIRPTVHVWNGSRPVAMDMFHGCRPFQSGRSPWVLRRFFSEENASEEIVQIEQLEYATDQCKDGDDNVHVCQIVEQRKVGIGIITSWKPCHTDKM